jgi:IKI3 family
MASAVIISKAALRLVANAASCGVFLSVCSLPRLLVLSLCRAALGLYALDLAYMVIAHSQRDPGEYMLELQQFAAIAGPELQRHAIDTHLGRFNRALQHLMAAGDEHFDDALDFAREKVGVSTFPACGSTTAAWVRAPNLPAGPCLTGPVALRAPTIWANACMCRA